MASIIKSFFIVLLLSFYGYIAFLVFNPHVSNAYRQYYIEKTTRMYQHPYPCRRYHYYNYDYISANSAVYKNRYRLNQRYINSTSSNKEWNKNERY